MVGLFYKWGLNFKYVIHVVIHPSFKYTFFLEPSFERNWAWSIGDLEVHKVRIAHESKRKREELTKISDQKLKNKWGHIFIQAIILQDNNT